MQKLMGFSSFITSKNKNHTKSACEAVFKNSKERREYRQYNYRRGGFDRNLDKIWFDVNIINYFVLHFND